MWTLRVGLINTFIFHRFANHRVASRSSKRRIPTYRDDLTSLKMPNRRSSKSSDVSKCRDVQDKRRVANASSSLLSHLKVLCTERNSAHNYRVNRNYCFFFICNYLGVSSRIFFITSHGKDQQRLRFAVIVTAVFSPRRSSFKVDCSLPPVLEFC